MVYIITINAATGSNVQNISHGPGSFREVSLIFFLTSPASLDDMRVSTSERISARCMKCCSNSKENSHEYSMFFVHNSAGGEGNQLAAPREGIPKNRFVPHWLAGER
jgi:hypothetical protein